MTRYNTDAGVNVDREVEFAVFDELPKDVRAFLRDAPFNVSSQSAASFHRTYFGRYDSKEIVTMLVQWARQTMLYDPNVGTVKWWTYFIKETKVQLLYAGLHDGNDHPQADKEYPWPDYQVRPRENATTRVVRIRRARR